MPSLLTVFRELMNGPLERQTHLYRVLDAYKNHQHLMMRTPHEMKPMDVVDSASEDNAVVIYLSMNQVVGSSTKDIDISFTLSEKGEECTCHGCVCSSVC